MLEQICLPKELMFADELSPREFRVLMALYSLSNDTGSLQLNRQDIAEKCQIDNLQSISKITSLLKNKGWLVKQKSGFQSSISYKLTIPKKYTKQAANPRSCPIVTDPAPLGEPNPPQKPVKQPANPRGYPIVTDPALLREYEEISKLAANPRGYPTVTDSALLGEQAANPRGCPIVTDLGSKSPRARDIYIYNNKHISNSNYKNKKSKIENSKNTQDDQPAKKYYFEGEKIKITENDFYKMRSLYPALNLTDELDQLDSELRDEKKWWMVLSAKLNYRNKKAISDEKNIHRGRKLSLVEEVELLNSGSLANDSTYLD